MIVDDLKKSILKYAITGKLTNRLDSDSSALDLLNKIKKKKEELYSKKDITKKQYIIPANNKIYTYDYPKEWVLTQIGHLGYVVGGGTPRTEIKEYFNGKISWITPKDMKKFNKYVTYGDRNITELGLKKSSAILMPKGTILCSSRAPIGYLGIASNELCTNQGFKSLVPLCNINSEYIYYYLMARVDDLKSDGDGTTFTEISGEDFSKFYIVLPSIEEQKRIVDKIEELFTKLDEIKPLEEKLTELKNDFSKDFRVSLLKSAVSGQLTKQKNTENVDELINSIESRINKKVSLIKEFPFAIPENWRWIKFGELVTFNIGKTPARADSSYWGNEYKWVAISDMVEDGIINDTKECVSSKAYREVFKENISLKGTLLMSFKLTVGRCSVLNIDAFHNEGIISVYPNHESEILKKYLMKILPFMTKYGDTKGAIKGNTLNSKSLSSLLIPLPPLEEQERIVNMIEELLPLCDDIDKLVNY